jgi:glucose-1-phosphate cytidylyltransferase
MTMIPKPPVVLLCGGLGLRQRTDVDDPPKAARLLPDGRSLLLHVLDYYRAFGLHEFVLCVGYGARAIERLLATELRGTARRTSTGAAWHRIETDHERVTLVDSGPDAEKSRRLLDARRHVGGRSFLLGYADILSDFDLNALVRRHRSTGGVLTLVATRVRSRYGELAIDAVGTVTEFVEKPLRPVLVSAGYFMCSPEIFDVLVDRFSFEDVTIPLLVERKQVNGVVHHGLWFPFDTYKDFIEIEEFMERAGSPWLVPV